MPVLPSIGNASQVTAQGPPRGRPISDMIVEVARWMRENVDSNVPGIAADAINDSIESLWESVITARVAKLLGGPVSLTLANATERVQLVSVSDPIVAPVVSAFGIVANILAISLATESGTETNLSPACAVQNIGIGSVVTAPAYVSGAFGYNVYAGPDAQHMFKQNVAPVDFNVNFTFTAIVGTDPELFPTAPAYNSTGDNIYYIHHLELLSPDSTYRAWTQADLDSELMRRAAGSMTTSSPYQNYMFDLIEGNTLEVRPALGSTLSPRYFFVYKPRILRFANALIPMSDVPGSWPFIRYNAISLLKLTVEEYQASQMWQGKAEAEMLKIRLAVGQQGARQNRRVTPFLMGR